MIVSSILMTAGCGALAVARRDNLATVWGLLIVAGLGIGGIVVPASIISEFTDLKRLRIVADSPLSHHYLSR